MQVIVACSHNSRLDIPLEVQYIDQVVWCLDLPKVKASNQV